MCGKIHWSVTGRRRRLTQGFRWLVFLKFCGGCNESLFGSNWCAEDDCFLSTPTSFPPSGPSWTNVLIQWKRAQLSGGESGRGYCNNAVSCSALFSSIVWTGRRETRLLLMTSLSYMGYCTGGNKTQCMTWRMDEEGDHFGVEGIKNNELSNLFMS